MVCRNLPLAEGRMGGGHGGIQFFICLKISLNIQTKFYWKFQLIHTNIFFFKKGDFNCSKNRSGERNGLRK